MDYSGAFDLSMKELHIDTDMENNVLYSGAFVATLPFMLVAGWALLRGYDWSACLAMSALIVLAGWLRWGRAVTPAAAPRRVPGRCPRTPRCDSTRDATRRNKPT